MFEQKRVFCNCENMEKRQDYLMDACVELEDLIEDNKKQLDAAQEDIEARDPGTTAPRSQIEKASGVAALETLKHNLATLQGGLKPSDCQHNCKYSENFHNIWLITIVDDVLVHSNSETILVSLARMWQTHSTSEILELLVEEKLKQALIREESNK